VGERLNPVQKRSVELTTSLGRREAVAAQLDEEQQALARARERLADAEKGLRELGFSAEEHDRLTREFEDAVAGLSRAKLSAEAARGDLKAAETALAAVQAEEKSYKSKEAELQEKRRYRVRLTALAEGFDRLRAELSSRAAPELADAAGDLLSEMTDGRYSALVVNEDYEATVLDDGERKPIISGGEEDIVNLALRLAVSRMIADRAGQDLSLLVLDEVFGSLDDIRRENLVGLLQSLKSRFEQIVLITHVEAIHDAVDNCIWVDYDESTKTSAVRVERDEAA
jgi:exonuclease SbcC